MRYLIMILALIVLSSCNQSSNAKKIGASNKQNRVITPYEFYGNYLPTREIRIKDYLLKGIEISTKETKGNYKIDLIYIRFSDLNTKEYYVVDKVIFKGDKNDFLIQANDPKIGELIISGKFFGDRGPRLEDFTGTDKIAFKGIINAFGFKNETLECTYFEGD